jgi:hypothetical protein
MMEPFWITSRLPKSDFTSLGIVIGRSLSLSNGLPGLAPLVCYHDCTIPDEAIDPLFDLWNEGKLMFGYEDDPEDQNHSKDYLRIMKSSGPQPDKLTKEIINPSGARFSPPAKKPAAIRRQRT